MISKLKYVVWFVLGAAFATATPFYAHKVNLLGYYSCCSFAPVSTLICLAIAGVIYWLGLRWDREAHALGEEAQKAYREALNPAEKEAS